MGCPQVLRKMLEGQAWGTPPGKEIIVACCREGPSSGCCGEVPCVVLGPPGDGLSKEAKEWLEIITECDGAEVQEGAWEIVKELVDEGLVTLGSARGPESAWRRAELVNMEEQYEAALEHIKAYPCPTCLPGQPDELCPYRVALKRLEVLVEVD